MALKVSFGNKLCEEKVSPFVIQYVLHLCVTMQAEQGKGDDDELRLGVAELQSAIFRTPKRISTPQAHRILLRTADDMKKSRCIK